MYYQRLLSEYKKKVIKNHQKFKDKEKYEKIVLVFELVGFFGFLLSFLLGYLFSNIIYLIFSMIFLVIIIGSIICSEYFYRQFNEAKLKKYDERLEKVKSILKNCEYSYYYLDCIDNIIDWCDKYAEEDDIWIRIFKPFGVFFTIFFIPVLIVLLDTWINKFGNKIEEVIVCVIAFILVAFCMFLLWNAFGDTIKGKLNKKKYIAKQLAEDLRNLKLKEPRIPEYRDQGRGDKEKKDKLNKSGR